MWNEVVLGQLDKRMVLLGIITCYGVDAEKTTIMEGGNKITQA